MKRTLAVLVIAAALALAPVLAMAQEAVPMSDAQIQRIRSNCVEAQATLRQLHASDALLRVNRGQLYESISTKLMAPFNSRVSLAKADGLNLTTITSSYERQLNEFRSNYKQYEEAMSGVLRLNCVSQPVAFYDSVADAREKRKLVHQSTQALQKSIQDYRAEFSLFRKNFLGEQ